MATILNIETSTEVCSVALTSTGFVLCHREDFNGPNHASVISDFIIHCMDYMKSHDNIKLDAISASLGPGSYTGLRIGLSEAKGLAYGLKLPLIGIDTLKIIAVETMFGFNGYDAENDVIIPMIDARRNEVYTAAFDGYLNYLEECNAKILFPESYKRIFKDKRMIFTGNGSKKAKEILDLGNMDCLFLPDTKPLATSMCALSEKCYNDNRFIDLAYSVPIYLKDFQATKPKEKLHI